MSITSTIRNTIKVTDPDKFEVGYYCGAIAAHGALTRSLRRTLGFAGGMAICAVVDHMLIPTVCPLVVRGWEWMKEVVTSRSFSATPQTPQETPATTSV